MINRDHVLAPEVKLLGDALVEKHLPELMGVRVEYVFTEKPMTSKGMEVWGKARKISSLNAFLAGKEDDQGEGVTSEFFVITISKPVWDQLTTKEKNPLVFHELCHCGVERDGDGSVTKLFVRPHDLEEFEAVVKKFGLWRESVKTFLDSARAAS